MGREAARCFQDLIVWRNTHGFVLVVYEVTKRFPREEVYGLTSQLRRAAVSIPASIAECFKKSGRADKCRFLNITQGSVEEGRYYLILAQDLGYLNNAALMDQIEEVSKLLNAYFKSIAARNTTPNSDPFPRHFPD